MEIFKKTLKLGMIVLLLGMVMACSKDKKTETKTSFDNRQAKAEEGKTVEPQRSGTTAGQEPSGDWRHAFTLVRDTIRTEPSRFPLKAPEGVRWSKSGNSLENSLFLAQLLRDNGYVVQIAEGEMDEAKAREFLEKNFPPASRFSPEKGVRTSAPAEDRNLINAVKRHFWVRMEGEDGWVKLDPCFPDAEPEKRLPCP